MEFIAGGMHFIGAISPPSDSSQDTILYLSIIGGVAFATLVCIECFNRFRNRRARRRAAQSDIEDSDDERYSIYENETAAPIYPGFQYSESRSDVQERMAARLASRYEAHEFSELERTYEAAAATYPFLPTPPPQRKRSSPIPITNQRWNADDFDSSSADTAEKYLPSSTDGERSPFPSGSSLGDSGNRMVHYTRWKNSSKPRPDYSSMSTLSADDHIMPQQSLDKPHASNVPEKSLDAKPQPSDCPDVEGEPTSPEPTDVILLEASGKSE